MLLLVQKMLACCTPHVGGWGHTDERNHKVNIGRVIRSWLRWRCRL